jgi:hypothetical protein
MGGDGSGRWREKTPVEDCLSLSVEKLQRNGLFRAGVNAAGSIGWMNTTTGKEFSAIGYEVSTLDTFAWLSVHYTLTRTGESVDYRVRLTASPLPWGGIRWSFLCPNTNCGRACRKLYLPSGARFFACRRCHRLTYRSAQEAHKYDSMFLKLGISPKLVREVFGRV